MSELPSVSLGLTSTVSYDSHSRGVTPAGSSSLLFTLNGVSSEDVDPTGGRYGSVALRAFGRGGGKPHLLPLLFSLELICSSVDLFPRAPRHALNSDQ